MRVRGSDRYQAVSACLWPGPTGVETVNAAADLFEGTATVSWSPVTTEPYSWNVRLEVPSLAYDVTHTELVPSAVNDTFTVPGILGGESWTATVEACDSCGVVQETNMNNGTF
jgi:hypothetical protein